MIVFSPHEAIVIGILPLYRPGIFLKYVCPNPQVGITVYVMAAYACVWQSKKKGNLECREPIERSDFLP